MLPLDQWVMFYATTTHLQRSLGLGEAIGVIGRDILTSCSQPVTSVFHQYEEFSKPLQVSGDVLVVCSHEVIQQVHGKVVFEGGGGGDITCAVQFARRVAHAKTIDYK